MAVKLPDGKIARTQPEQVKKNMDDIESIKSELVIIKEGIASAYKIQGSEDVADLNALEKAEDMNGYVYNMLDAGNLVNEDASTLSVQIGDNVVFVWNGGDWYWDRLAGLVDTSNLCTLDTEQTITKEKTFNDGLKTSNVDFIDTTWSISGDTVYDQLQISKGNNPLIKYTLTDVFPRNSQNLGSNTYRWSSLYLSTYLNLSGFVDSILRPRYNNTYDLGTSTVSWRDLYLSGIAYTNKVKAASNADIKITGYNNTDILSMSDNSIRCGVNLLPTYNQDKTLGLNTDGYRWAGLYLKPSAPISDGTNSVAVAEIHKIYKHTVITSGGTLIIHSYIQSEYSGTVRNITDNTYSKIISIQTTGNKYLYIDGNFGLYYFTNTGTFVESFDGTETITSDTVEVQ